MVRKILLALFACLFLASAASAAEPRFQWKTATLAPDGIGWDKHMK
ncbi:MAG: C4-dicarboxylate ABC transporter substrate-binding protein, partial [Deltaproteobacteria bacterium]|nr:C4-dicarboxylate ABC transporter substrate-binding protein [Deltaproteobacteria bacterium]